MNNYFILLIIIFFAGCGGNIPESQIIRIKGSDTMYELTSNLAEAYMKEHPGISVIVEGGGTAVGIKALIENKIDICTASRNLKPYETKMLAEYYSSLGLIYLIAKDGLSIYVNPGNPLKSFTTDQVKGIFTGGITNWEELGGNNSLIIPIIRNPNSGTYLYFLEHVLEDENYSASSLIKPTTKEIVNSVSENINAIGYGGMGYNENIIHALIDGIEPSVENVRNDSYPITRYLHFFTAKTPGGITKHFIDWVLSPSGQSVVSRSGYISLWEYNL